MRVVLRTDQQPTPAVWGGPAYGRSIRIDSVRIVVVLRGNGPLQTAPIPSRALVPRRASGAGREGSRGPGGKAGPRVGTYLADVCEAYVRCRLGTPSRQ